MRARLPLPLFAAVLCLPALAGLGCGSEEALDPEPATEARAPAAAPTPDSAPAADKAVTVAALGDSITAGSPLWDPDPAIRAQIGAALDETSQYEHWAAEADAGLEFRNCGVFGERTDQIAQRLDECAAGADALIVQGGINDIAQGRPVADAADDLRSMIQRGQDLGLEVAIVDVLPWNNGRPFADEPIIELNDLIAQIAAKEEVPLLPFHDTLVDPAEPAAMKPEWTDDGDHPSIEGYRRLGEIAFELP